MAPSKLSNILPNIPRPAPTATSSPAQVHPTVRQAGFSISKSMTWMMPMAAPPKADAQVPSEEMAPLVPGGTLWNVMIWSGGNEERIPSSEASVSAKMVAFKLYQNQQRIQHYECPPGYLTPKMCKARAWKEDEEKAPHLLYPTEMPDQNGRVKRPRGPGENSPVPTIL